MRNDRAEQPENANEEKHREEPLACPPEHHRAIPSQNAT
jgi:hypothetical protein